MREKNARALKRIFEGKEDEVDEEEEKNKKIPPEQKKEKESDRDIKPLSETTMKALQAATNKVINNGDDEMEVLNDLNVKMDWLDDQAERDYLESEGWLEDL